MGQSHGSLHATESGTGVGTGLGPKVYLKVQWPNCSVQVAAVLVRGCTTALHSAMGVDLLLLTGSLKVLFTMKPLRVRALQHLQNRKFLCVPFTEGE